MLGEDSLSVYMPRPEFPDSKSLPDSPDAQVGEEDRAVSFSQDIACHNDQERREEEDGTVRNPKIESPTHRR